MKNLNLSKRLLCAVIAFIIATFVGIPFISAETEGPFQYTVYNAEARIAKCDQSVQGHLDIPETLGGYPVTVIGYQSFVGCYDLTSITIPPSVHSLVGGAFMLTGLTEVTIPKSVTRIDGSVFADCYNMSGITVEEGNPNYVSIDGVLFTKDLTELMCYPTGKTGNEYEIPKGVQKVRYWAFSGNPYLQRVVLPDTVTAVSEDSFYACETLTDVTVPASVSEIGEAAFGWSYDMEVDFYCRIPGFVMHGYAGTAAEQYCLKDDLDFDVLNQKGDNNHDDTINAKDALVALQLAVNKIESTPGLVQVTDVNGDTHVNAKDALEILKKAVGKPACF